MKGKCNKCYVLGIQENLHIVLIINNYQLFGDIFLSVCFKFRLLAEFKMHIVNFQNLDLDFKACMLSHFSQVLTLQNPMNYSLPGSSVHGILQARLLECHSLLQGIFLTQGSNTCVLCLLLWQTSSLPLAPPGKL